MANLYGPRIVTDGLVLHLDAANRKSYPGSGSTWYDLSGRNNHVSWQQSPTGGTNGNSTISWSSSNNGKFQFTTANNDQDYFFRADTTTGLPTGDPNYTIDIVASMINGNAAWHLFAYGNQTSQQSNGIYFNTGNALTKYFYSNDWNMINNFSTTVGYGNIFNYTETYDPSTNLLKGYLNGSLIVTHTVSVNPNITLYGNGRLAIGGGVITANRANWGGDMYSVKLYNTTLSANEVQQNYNALKGRFGL